MQTRGRGSNNLRTLQTSYVDSPDSPKHFSPWISDTYLFMWLFLPPPQNLWSYLPCLLDINGVFCRTRGEASKQWVAQTCHSTTVIHEHLGCWQNRPTMKRLLEPRYQRNQKGFKSEGGKEGRKEGVQVPTVPLHIPIFIRCFTVHFGPHPHCHPPCAVPAQYTTRNEGFWGVDLEWTFWGPQQGEQSPSSLGKGGLINK